MPDGFPAYLVLCKEGQWEEVFRLTVGKSFAIGRAASNFIVLHDERCSRIHAEISFSQTSQTWVLFDKGSRNGTVLNGQRIVQNREYPLKPRDMVRLGSTQLMFLHELSDSPAHSESLRKKAEPLKTKTLSNPLSEIPVGKPVPPSISYDIPVEDQTVVDFDSANVLSGAGTTEETLITCRRDRAKVLDSLGMTQSAMNNDRQTRSFVASLCRLAIEITGETGMKNKLNLALKCLLTQLPMNHVAILLLPNGGVTAENRPDEHQLEVMAAAAKNTNKPYQRVSDFLAQTVLESKNAIIAKHVRNDSILGRRNSEGIIDTTSVICAPIYDSKRLWGLIHAYATDASKVPGEFDLDFTLGVAEVLAPALENLRTESSLTERLTQAKHENDDLRQRLGVQSELVGGSSAMQDITEQIAMAAGTRSTVLIRGESGVGKELVARAVHYSSSRKKQPFICLNCAALPEDLLASELFGHERGAFTGATERKIGKLEAANGGSLMLDEIGEMSLASQAKFLRVLEGHAFERVGGNKPIQVDVRVIAATNRDLEQEVLAGRFRKDLFFRLRVIEILVPSLRERRSDIPELATHFFEQYRTETGKRLRGFTPEAMNKLMLYDWPGNVRELKNVVERAVVFARDEWILPENLLLSHLSQPDPQAPPVQKRDEAFRPVPLEEVELEHIRRVLEYTEGNKSQAAILLGIGRPTLDRKLRKIASGSEGDEQEDL